MISGYLSRQSWLHRVPAGAKLLALAAVSFAVLPVQDWRLLAGGLFLVVALAGILGTDALRRVLLLRPLLPLLAVIFALHALAGDWQAGIGSVARLLMMVMLADIVSMTTTMQDMMRALMPVLRLLRPFGVNPRKVSLAVSLVVRFVPLLASNWEARSEAWRARTGRKQSWRLVAPFLAETLRMADQIAESLDARGFGRRG